MHFMPSLLGLALVAATPAFTAPIVSGTPSLEERDLFQIIGYRRVRRVSY